MTPPNSFDGAALTRRRKIGFFSIAFFVIVQGVLLYVIFSSPERYLLDFRTFDSFAYSLTRGLNPYSLAQDEFNVLADSRWGLPVSYPYRYSPFLLFVLIPFTHLSPILSAFMWSCASISAFIISGFLMSKLRAGNWLDPLVFFMQSLFAPTLITVAAGQVNAFVLFSLVLAVYALDSRRSILAGGSIAIGTLIKVIPVVLCAHLVLRRGWKPLFWVAISTLFLFLISLAVVPPGLWLDYIMNSASLAGAGKMSVYPENEGIWTFFARIFPSQLAYPSALAASIMVGMIIAIVLWRGRRFNNYLLDMSLLLSGMSLIAPISWLHLQVILLLPFTILLRDFNIDNESHINSSHAAVFASFVLLNFQAITWRYFEEQPLIGSMGTYGIVILFVALVWRVSHSGTTNTESEPLC